VLTAEDIQNGLRSRDYRRIELSPLAATLLATLLNSWIYEGQDDQPNSRTRRCMDFVIEELPDILETLRNDARQSNDDRSRTITSVDIIHWMRPRWPQPVIASPILGFIFSKE